MDKFLEETITKTAKAYQLKYGFDQIWKVQKLTIEPPLTTWMNKAKESLCQPIIAFKNMIQNHYDGVVNAMGSFYNIAVAEGINSQIQMTKYRARGFRNVENFMNMIYLINANLKFTFHN